VVLESDIDFYCFGYSIVMTYISLLFKQKKMVLLFFPSNKSYVKEHEKGFNQRITLIV
jgi:hypothetical protein